MAADHLQFLKDRFIREFHEAEEEFSDEFPLHPQFHDIEKFLQERIINPSTPIEMRNGLYDLLYELKECYMLAEKERDRQKERDRRIQNMKSKFDVFTYNIKERMVMMPTTVKKQWFIYTTRKKLFLLKRNLELVKEDAATAESSLLSNSIKVWNSSWLQSGHKIHGFDNELQKIRALLFKKADHGGGIKTIGIVGMSGVGKTTLALRFVSSWSCRCAFSPIIWVTLSQNLNPSEITRQLLETLSDNDAQISNHDAFPEQLRDLHNRLSNKKYLIVLDNVWHQNEWYSDLGSNLQTEGNISHLCHGLPKGGGGAIIVTSRLEELATRMVGEQNLLKLQPLFDAGELWSMFMDSIQRKEFLTSDHHQMLSRMKDEIIDRCDGLPLVAKTLAEVLSIQLGKEEYWSIVDVRKKFRLRLDQLDVIFYYEAMKNIRTLPGVEDVTNGPSVAETTIIGRCLPVEIARELRKLCHTELISVEDISNKKYMVLKLGLDNNKEDKKAMKIVSNISGFESFTMDMNEKKLTVFGDVDPEEVVSKLCKYWHADILSIGPVKQHLKDEKSRKKQHIHKEGQHLKEKKFQRLQKQQIRLQLKNQLDDFENGTETISGID